MQGNDELRLQVSYRQIMRMAAPISFAIFVPQFNFITNNIFLGHYDSSGSSLALAGLTGVYYLIFAAIGFGLNNGLQALISRRAGEGRPEEIGKLFNQGVLISLATALAGIVITWLFLPTVFGWIMRDATRMEQAIRFLNIRIMGLPFLYLYQMRNALLVGINQSKFLVAGTLMEAVSNVLLDYLFIFGVGFFPELGFNGAAVASVISEFLGMWVIYLVIRRQGINTRFGLLSNLRLHKGISMEIIRFSYPLVFQQAISIAAWEYFFLLLEHQGTTALQVSNAMRNVFGIFGTVCWALGATTNAMVSNIIGQGMPHLLWKLIGQIMILSSSFALVAGVFLYLHPVAFLSLYGQSGDFLQAGIPTVKVVALAVVLMSVAGIALNAVVGVGNSRYTFFTELFALIGYTGYVFWVIEIKNYPVYMAWTSEWIYWLSLFVPSVIYLFRFTQRISGTIAPLGV